MKLQNGDYFKGGIMARKPTGNPNGRPPAQIEQRQFEALCAIQCTEEEICSVLGVDEATLIKWCKATYGETFSKVYKIKKLGGKASLRRMQWKLAEKSAPVAIWLGKQYLGQHEKTIPIDSNGDDVLDKICQSIQKIRESDDE